MTQEEIVSGYCRILDQSRMVTVETEDGKLLEADCCYGSCIYEPNCTIAKSIRTLCEKAWGKT